jgi:putative transcriptional regulator
MTQARFSNDFGFSLDAVKHWEGGRKTPEASAHAFLTVIARNPQAVIVTLHGEQKTPSFPSRSAPRSQKGRAARKK